MKIRDKLLNLLYPPVCVACGELLEYSTESPLCPICRSKWEAEKRYICPECRVAHRDCVCVTPAMAGRIGRAYHVAEYTDSESTARSMTLFAKDHAYKYLYELIASETASLLSEKEELGGTVMTFVPRSRDAISKSGVDQAYKAAKLTAGKLNIPFVCAFARKKTGQQKKLDTAGRRASAGSAYSPINEHMPAINGKKVILYDDVVTTGATMCACAKLLIGMGAREVICASFCKTYKKRDKNEKYSVKTYKQKEARLTTGHNPHNASASNITERR